MAEIEPPCLDPTCSCCTVWQTLDDWKTIQIERLKGALIGAGVHPSLVKAIAEDDPSAQEALLHEYRKEYRKEQMAGDRCPAVHPEYGQCFRMDHIEPPHRAPKGEWS